MDRNGSTDLKETTVESERETLRWLEACDRFKKIKPILTPRFTPSCSDELMGYLGRLAVENNLPIQSHLSVNLGEIQWVKEHRPGCKEYWKTYADSGLWNNRTLMAHCVHSRKRERKAMADSGVTVVHCSSSNTNLCSGIAPIRQVLNENVNVVLGSDISGGDCLNGFDVVASTVRTSKNCRVLDGCNTDPLTEKEAWYLGTSASAQWFGAGKGFAKDDYLHAVIIDDSCLLTENMTLEERFLRCIYKRQENAVCAVWSEGQKIFQRNELMKPSRRGEKYAS